MMVNTIVLRAADLGVRGPGRGNWLLRGVALQLGQGSVVGVAGTNGSGKSTLLRVLSGVRRPHEGTVWRRSRARLVTADTPAGIRTSARKYLMALGRIAGVDARELRKEAEQVLAELGLRADWDRPISELSTGEQRRVMLGQAFLGSPDLIFLDEPTHGLDRVGRDAVTRMIRERAAAGGALVVVDHDRAWAARICDYWHQVSDQKLTAASAPELDLAGAGRDGDRMRMEFVQVSDLDDIRSFPGVLSAIRRDGLVAVEVRADAADRLLLHCLGRGVTVRRVEPDERTGHA